MPKLLSFKEYVEMAEAYKKSKLYWFHVRSKKLVPVTEDWHDWGPVSRPEAFGLKHSQVMRFEGPMERGNDIIDGVADLMSRAGWVRCSARQHEWSIRSKTIADAGITAKALSKKHPNPLNIYVDHGSDSTVLQPDQIADFIKTGKIVTRTEIGSTMARFR